MHPEVKPLARLCGDGVDNPQGQVLAAWDDILDINYWAIFAIAKDILEQLPSGDAAEILRRLRHTAQSVNATGVGNAHDLTGRIFQRLIADRKYLATFYTLPASAALLARAGSRQDGGRRLVQRRGHRQAANRRLRLRNRRTPLGGVRADCRRHERAGGDAAALHRVMMEDVLYGCDVMPSAVHITGLDTLRRGAAVLFNNSHLYTMPYGRMKDNSVMIGSWSFSSPQTSDAVQHQRPSHAHRKRGRGDGCPDTRRDTRRQLRPRDNEPTFTRNVTRGRRIY